jgi:oxygen-dependent protoporphyrinogen oxidase
MAPVTIIGGGISGLSAAYYLAKAGIPSKIIEPRTRLGGVIQTEHVEDCVIEAGPDSFLSVKPAAMDLIRELGIADQVVGSNDHLRKTYVLRHGRLVPLPDGLMLMVPTRVLPLVTTSLLSWPTKIRMGLELFRSPGRHGNGDQSVAEFVEAHYGREAVEYLAEPLLSGIYGGNPEALSVTSVLPRFVELDRRYGSLTKGVLAERRAVASQAASLPLFRTLRGGLGDLVTALEHVLEGQMEVIPGRAEAVAREGSGYRVWLNESSLFSEHVVVATEAYNAARLVPDARLAELLASVPYSSSMTLAFGFDAAAFPRPLEGFGFLVPKKERRRLVACTWVGTKFPHRVPAGTVVVRCFLGGMDDPTILSDSDETVIPTALDELRRIVPFHGVPRFTRVFRWPKSMAQYAVGHPQKLAEIRERLSGLPGLHLAGNAYEGIGVPDCIRMGKQAAQTIAGTADKCR